MGQVTKEQVDLMLHLYELRREPRLREARSWYVTNFYPQTLEEAGKDFPPGSEGSTSMRMVLSYWDMVASIVNRGLIDEEFFFENSGEQWIVFERAKPILAAWRKMFANPYVFSNLEEHVKRLDAWREKRSPGATATMRQVMQQMMEQMARAQGQAKAAGD